MSRFYDILKEANRHVSPSAEGEFGRNGKIPSGTPLGAAGNVAAPQIPIPNIGATNVAANMAATHVIAEESPVSMSAPKNGAVAVHASLDRKARLLPHIADTVVVEQYRRLRTKLLQERENRPFRVLMIGSPNPQEGKTVTAFNLALSFGMLPSCKVLLVDGDLRKGSLGKWLTVSGLPGLSDLIEGTSRMEDVILKSDELPIHFVLRGNSKISAPELLNSPNLKLCFQEMAEQYDVVIVDTPPVGLVTDAQLLAKCCDAVLLVGRAFSTTCKAIEKAVQDLQPFRIVGTILNGGARVKRYRRYNGYY